MKHSYHLNILMKLILLALQQQKLSRYIKMLKNTIYLHRSEDAGIKEVGYILDGKYESSVNCFMPNFAGSSGVVL